MRRYRTDANRGKEPPLLPFPARLAAVDPEKRQIGGGWLPPRASFSVFRLSSSVFREKLPNDRAAALNAVAARAVARRSRPLRRALAARSDLAHVARARVRKAREVSIAGLEALGAREAWPLGRAAQHARHRLVVLAARRLVRVGAGRMAVTRSGQAAQSFCATSSLLVKYLVRVEVLALGRAERLRRADRHLDTDRRVQPQLLRVVLEVARHHVEVAAVDLRASVLSE